MRCQLWECWISLRWGIGAWILQKLPYWFQCANMNNQSLWKMEINASWGTKSFFKTENIFKCFCLSLNFSKLCTLSHKSRSLDLMGLTICCFHYSWTITEGIARCNSAGPNLQTQVASLRQWMNPANHPHLLFNVACLFSLLIVPLLIHKITELEMSFPNNMPQILIGCKWAVDLWIL